MKTVAAMQGAVPADHCRDLEQSLQPNDGLADATPANGTAQIAGMTEAGFRDLKAFTEYLEQLPPSTRTVEEINQQVAEERASWD